jgi:uncharacterized membrane protein
MTDLDGVYGPVDIVVLQFDAAKVDGSAGRALMDLVDQGTIRIYDLLVVEKQADGSVIALELTDISPDALGGFASFAGARSGLVDDDDLADAAALLDPGKAALLLVYENTWAVPFVAAARRAGGELIASSRIPADVLTAALDALDAAS